MTDSPEITYARELLANGIPTPLDHTEHAALIAALDRVIAMDATREPLLIGTWNSENANKIFSYAYAFSTNPDGSIQCRSIYSREGINSRPSPFRTEANRSAHTIRASLAQNGVDAQNVWLRGFWIFDVDRRLLQAVHFVGDATLPIRQQSPYDALDALSALWFHERQLEGRTYPPIEISKFTAITGTWELDATAEGTELIEGRDDDFDMLVRSWPLLTDNQQDDAGPQPWQPVRGSAVRISLDGTLRERVSTTPSRVPWWGIDGILRNIPLPIDGQLRYSNGWELWLPDMPTMPTHHRSGGYGLETLVRDEWVREADGSLVRTVHAFNPSARSVSTRLYRYHRTSSVPDAVFEIPAPRPPLPEAPTLPGVWELRAWFEDPDLVQFRDDEKVYYQRARSWERTSELEISLRDLSWQPVSGTRLTIYEDDTFTEEVTGPATLTWWDENVGGYDHPEPFDGHVLEHWGRKHYLVPEGTTEPRWSGGEHEAVNNLFLRPDGSLVRVQSIKFDDGYVFLRIFLRYEKVGPAPVKGEGGS